MLVLVYLGPHPRSCVAFSTELIFETRASYIFQGVNWLYLISRELCFECGGGPEQWQASSKAPRSPWQPNGFIEGCFVEPWLLRLLLPAFLALCSSFVFAFFCQRGGSELWRETLCASAGLWGWGLGRQVDELNR